MDVTNAPESNVDEIPPVARKPRTLSVLGLLALAAGSFSYLGAYAATGALVDANVIRPIRTSPDPRPLWALISFATLMIVFLIIAMLMRYVSARQFRRIDRMVEEG